MRIAEVMAAGRFEWREPTSFMIAPIGPRRI